VINEPLVQGMRRLLAQERYGELMDAIRDIGFLIEDGSIRREGIALRTKSTDYAIHKSVFETAKRLGLIGADEELHLNFGFGVKDKLGKARAWEHCTSSFSKCRHQIRACRCKGERSSSSLTAVSTFRLFITYTAQPRAKAALVFV
jgi:hypothetical protein